MPHLFVHDTVLSDRRLPLPGRVVVLGRSLDADVPVPHHSVSRRHALIERADRGYLLSDLGSHNGTFLGDRRLEPGERVDLPVGGLFRIGQVAILLAADETIGEKPLSLGPPLADMPKSASPSGGSALAPATPPAERVRPGVRRVRRGRGPAFIALLSVALVVAAGLLLWRIVALHREQKKPPPPPSVREKPSEDEGPQPIRLPK